MNSKKKRNNVISRIVDARGRTAVEFYHSKHKGAPCVRFRVIGGNGEIMNDPYDTVHNAKKGAEALRDRINEILL